MIFTYSFGAIIPFKTSNSRFFKSSPFVLTANVWVELGFIEIISLFVSKVNGFKFFKINGASEIFFISIFLIVDFPSSE